MRTITSSELDELVQTARSSIRQRKNLNIHPELSDPVQRLCNAFEPGSYVRPHQHSEENRWELFIALKGKAIILTFDQEGTVLERVIISDRGPNHIVEIPPQTWHTVLAVESGTVLFESKPGPYSALSDKDFASWAPDENTPAAQVFVDWFEQAQAGDQPPVID